jgi:hypothetical protein
LTSFWEKKCRLGCLRYWCPRTPASSSPSAIWATREGAAMTLTRLSGTWTPPCCRICQSLRPRAGHSFGASGNVTFSGGRTGPQCGRGRDGGGGRRRDGQGRHGLPDRRFPSAAEQPVLSLDLPPSNVAPTGDELKRPRGCRPVSFQHQRNRRDTCGPRRFCRQLEHGRGHRRATATRP